MFFLFGRSWGAFGGSWGFPGGLVGHLGSLVGHLRIGDVLVVSGWPPWGFRGPSGGCLLGWFWEGLVGPFGGLGGFLGHVQAGTSRKGLRTLNLHGAQASAQFSRFRGG